MYTHCLLLPTSMEGNEYGSHALCHLGIYAAWRRQTTSKVITYWKHYTKGEGLDARRAMIAHNIQSLVWLPYIQGSHRAIKDYWRQKLITWDTRLKVSAFINRLSGESMKTLEHGPWCWVGMSNVQDETCAGWTDQRVGNHSAMATTDLNYKDMWA